LAKAKDDLDIKFGICSGVGLTVEATAELCDVSRTTFYEHTKKNLAAFDRWRRFGEQLKLKAIEPAVKKAEVASTNEERMSAVFLRGLSLSEKLLQKIEDKGEEATIEELRDIHKQFTRWAAPWAASQAPKRVQIEGEVVHAHTMLDETATRLTGFLGKYEAMGLLPPAEVEEAEIVS
jgi:hypothetical protein